MGLLVYCMTQAANRLVLFPGSLVSLTARLTRITRFDRRAVSNLTLVVALVRYFFILCFLEGKNAQVLRYGAAYQFMRLVTFEHGTSLLLR